MPQRRTKGFSTVFVGSKSFYAPFLIYIPFALYVLVLCAFEISGTPMQDYFVLYRPFENILRQLHSYHRDSEESLIAHGFANRAPIILHAITVFHIYLVAFTVWAIIVIVEQIRDHRRIRLRVVRAVLMAPNRGRLFLPALAAPFFAIGAAVIFGTFGTPAVSAYFADRVGRYSSFATDWTWWLIIDGLYLVGVLWIVFFSAVLAAHVYPMACKHRTLNLASRTSRPSANRAG